MKPLSKLILLFIISFCISCSSNKKDLAREPASVEVVEPVDPINLEVDVDIPEEIVEAVEDDWGDDESDQFGQEFPEELVTGAGSSSEPKAGKLAVFCPRQMTYKQTSDIIGFIADLIDDELIEDMMLERVSEVLEDESFELQDNDLLIRELQYYSRIELRLDDSDNEGFIIKKVHEDDLQVISENMEGWHWKVTPTTNNPEQQLILKVIVYNSEGEKITSFGKTYYITIRIEPKLFIRNTLTLFVENPEWAFASIITPIITFLIGRYNSRKRRKRKNLKEKVG